MVRLAEEALAAVRDSWPGLTWAGVEVPDQGLDHGVVILEGPAGPPLLSDAPVRAVARLAVAPGVVGRADVEAGVVAALDGAPALLPAAYVTDGASLSLARHVPGEPVSAQVWERLDKGQRSGVIEAVAGTLSRLHALEAPDIGESWFPVKHRALIERVGEHVAPTRTAVERDRVDAIFARAEHLFIDSPVPPRPIHGDLHETHLRFDGRRTGLIDFSDMTLADPAIDIAHLPGISGELGHAVGKLLGGDLRDRASAYANWDAVFLMADHLATGRTPASVARPLFAKALGLGRA